MRRVASLIPLLFLLILDCDSKVDTQKNRILTEASHSGEVLPDFEKTFPQVQVNGRESTIPSTSINEMAADQGLS